MSGERNSSKPQDILLPGWRWVKLGDVCELIMGQSPPGSTYTDKPEGLPFFQGKADFGEYSPKVRVWCTQPMKVAEEGDILISVRAPVGPVNMNNLKCCLGRGLAAIRCKDSAMHWFIFWYLRSKEIQITSLGSGSTFSAITRDDLENLEIPLPPLSEQKRISTKIQKLMQEVEHARTACGKQLAAANALRASYLREIFESEEAKKWERKRLGEVCEFLDSMRIPVNDGERQKRIAGKKQTELYPYYGANGQVGWIDNFIFDEELVLLAEDGGFFGSFEKPIAYRVGGKCWVNNHAHVLRTNREIIDVDWLYFSLGIRPDIMCFVSGTTRPKLNQEQASKIPIPLPSILIQQRIAADLKGKMAEVENLESTIQNQQSALNSFPQAILRQAFNGEL